MKKTAFLLIAALLCGSLLCACGSGDSSAASFQGNSDSFHMDAQQLTGTVAGDWVNRDDPDETVTVRDDGSLVHRRGGQEHNGKLSLNEQTGLLTVAYDDGFLPEKTYVWVDSKKNISANTWYVDGGSFAFGGVYYIRN